MAALFSVFGSILGAGVLDIFSLHKYVAVRRDFQTPHVWGYFFAPWLAAVLGLNGEARVTSQAPQAAAGPANATPSVGAHGPS
jgi:hypothetical protein